MNSVAWKHPRATGRVGWLHTATPTGLFLAALVTLGAGSLLGWRGMFFLGILPALLIFYLRRNIPEPKRAGSAGEADSRRLRSGCEPGLPRGRHGPPGRRR